jgi:hypothetical protein
MKCQYRTTCGNPATTKVTFFGRDYRLCSTCERQLQSDIAALRQEAQIAADQVTGLLAGHFGISTQQAAPAAQALVSQMTSNAWERIIHQQRGTQQTRPIPIHGPAPSADHPHPADWACDHLCRPPAPAASAGPQQATQGDVTFSSTTPPAASAPAVQPTDHGAADKPRTGPGVKAVHRKLTVWAAACGTAFIAGLILMASGHPGDVYYSSTPRVAWGVVIMVLSVIVPVCAVILTAISEGVDAHHHWISQHPPEQQAAIRKAERAAAWGAVAAGSVALHQYNKRAAARNAASVIGNRSVPTPGTSNTAMHPAWVDQQQTGSFGPQPKMWQQP